MPPSAAKARRDAFPWEPQSARRAQIALEGLREMLVRRLRAARGLHPPTLICAVGALTGFAAQNAALDQALILSGRRDLVAPKSLLVLSGPGGARHLFGSWVNAPLLAGYGHAAPLQRFLTEAAARAGVDKADLPNFRAIEARVSAGIGEAGFGTVRASAGHAPRAHPPELLKALWPQCRRIICAPMAVELADEPALHEAHWPVLLSVLAGALMTMTTDRLDPRISAALAMESAVVAARLDPELIDPGHWRLAPGAAGLSVARDEAARRVA